MQRRDFLGFTAVVSGGMLLSACGDSDADSSQAPLDTQEKPQGAVTLYYEFRVAGPENMSVLSNVESLQSTLTNTTGFLSLSLKQMTGESTMVKNYPDALKGVLDRGYAQVASAQGTPGMPTSTKIPFFYALLIRFDSYDNMIDSGAKEWFSSDIVPSLFAYNGATTPPTKTSIELDYYEGVYITVAAGDREGIYDTPEAINTFLKNQTDEISHGYVTVENHVMIKDLHREVFNTKIKTLLTTAQNTFRPAQEDLGADLTSYPNGQAGAADNTHYRKAVTTEILQNAYADGELRSYLMHGVWESMYDHENSHIDQRFAQAAGPVGAYVVVGPVEPFYDTIKQFGAKV